MSMTTTVGRSRRRRLDGGLAVADLVDDLDAAVGLEDLTQSLAHREVILDQEDSYLFARSASPCPAGMK